jgi:adenylate cyclase
VMMPGISGYEVCQAIRADPVTRALPVILVTALDSSERVKGLEAGADDFITKPISQPELLARVKSLLRIKALYDEVQLRREELADWNRTLEQRVADGMADLILSGNAADPLRSHRSEIVVVFVDLRGYTAFSEAADPEDVMGVLREYHAAMGRLIMAYQGTLERFGGDSIMIFFNDPIPLPNAAEHAIRMALGMQEGFAGLARGWAQRGYDLNIGIGIAQGFEGRLDYGAIGTVCSLAARLCAHATGGQTLVSQRVLGSIEDLVEAASVGELELKGFHRPVPAFNVTAIRRHADQTGDRP